MEIEKFQNKFRISSARLSEHDYSGGIYFVTICTADMVHYFGKIENDVINLSKIGEYAEENLMNITKHYPYCEILLFVVMPNHIHLIAFIDGENIVETMRASSLFQTHNDSETVHAPSLHNRQRKNEPVNEKMQLISHRKGRLSVVIGGFKSSVTRYANRQKMTFAWQNRFHDRVIRNQKELNSIAEYIENNVIQWKIDRYNN